MKRNQITTLDKLQPGDRFHFPDDKKKIVMQVIGQPQPPIAGRVICVPALIMDSPNLDNINLGNYKKAYHSQREVTYLRSINN